jgi:hypothetical protein
MIFIFNIEVIIGLYKFKIEMLFSEFWIIYLKLN